MIMIDWSGPIRCMGDPNRRIKFLRMHLFPDMEELIIPKIGSENEITVSKQKGYEVAVVSLFDQDKGGTYYFLDGRMHGYANSEDKRFKKFQIENF